MRGAHRARRGTDLVGTGLALLALTGATLVGIALVDSPTESRPPQAVAPPAGPPAPRLLAVAKAPSAAPRDRPAVLPASRPVRLTIPTLGLTSAVQQVGQAQDGTVAVPPPGPTYDQAAWYRYSPVPGARGPAVIVGHVDSKARGPSVFFHLDRLSAGDRVEVSRADGSVADFVVTSVSRYRKTRFPTAQVYGNTAGAELRLITCGGPFDRAGGHYLDNVVVTARLDPQASRDSKATGRPG